MIRPVEHMLPPRKAVTAFWRDVRDVCRLALAVYAVGYCFTCGVMAAMWMWGWLS